MTPEELQEALSFGREQRGVEFKGPGRRDQTDFMAKVTRAILGMANNEDGGEVVIGVQDETVNLVGLSEDELATWGDDAVKSVVSNYADPYVDLDVRPVVVGAKTAVVITVQPFVESPVICKKEYSSPSEKKILAAGVVYVRGRGKVETVPASTHTQMREVLDRAAEATARRLIGISRRLEPGPTDAEKFANEANDLP
jgi:predicted HTH transcriptional regulator